MTQLTDDVDLKTFAELFDTALTSNNPAVKKCLHNLLVIAALVHAEETDTRNKGPLGNLLDEVETMKKKVDEIHISTLYQHPAYNETMYTSNTTPSYYGPKIK
jgi:hypothetical protein